MLFVGSTERDTVTNRWKVVSGTAATQAIELTGGFAVYRRGEKKKKGKPRTNRPDFPTRGVRILLSEANSASSRENSLTMGSSAPFWDLLDLKDPVNFLPTVIFTPSSWARVT